MTARFLPVRLTIPIPGVNDDWPELLLPYEMDSKAWEQMMGLLEVMKPGVVTRADRRPLLAKLATALRARVDAA